MPKEDILPETAFRQVKRCGENVRLMEMEVSEAEVGAGNRSGGVRDPQFNSSRFSLLCSQPMHL